MVAGGLVVLSAFASTPAPSAPFTALAPQQCNSNGPLTFTPDDNTILPNASVGVSYRQSIKVAGGTPPYRWRIFVGELPPGLSIQVKQGNQDEVEITGTPTPDETPWFGFSLFVEDSAVNQKVCISRYQIYLNQTAHNGVPRQNLKQEPPKECPRCDEADKGDPVSLNNGEFSVNAVDLEISGRGFDWQFERRYRSGSTFTGPLGRNWDFGDNRRLVEAHSGNMVEFTTTFPSAKAGDVARMDGVTRTELYTRNADGTYSSPSGSFTRLVKTGLGQFVERDRTGASVEYEILDGDPGTRVARMISLSDRNGNTMRYSYDARGQLVRVHDTLGRPIDYAYNDAGFLTRVTDFSGRSVTFTYTSRGDLRSVTSPAVTGTPNGNDFPAGKTITYDYSAGHADDRLNHNLTRVFAPKEQTSLRQRLFVEYDTNASSPNMDRVLSQRRGGERFDSETPAAGGTISYAYATLAAPSPPGINDAVNETIVTDANGNRTEYRFNALGNVVRKRELTNRDVDPSEPSHYETTYQYNADGQVVREVMPEGTSISYTYDSGNSDRLQRGNVKAVVMTPDPDRGGDQTFVRETASYEPIYNKVRAVTEPRGNDPSYIPQNGGARTAARYTTTITFDYQEGCNFAAIGTKVGVTAARAQALLSAAGICAQPLGDVNGDGRTDQVAGNVVRVAYPNVALAAACTSGKLTQAAVGCSQQARVERTSQQPVVEFFSYNVFGQIVRQVDAERNTTLFAYYRENDPDGDGRDPTPGTGTGPFGYLKQITADALAGSARNSGTGTPPTAVRNRFGYDRVGNIVRAVDGRGIATDYAVNQLNEVVQVTRAAAHGVFTPAPAEPRTLTDFQYRERLFYDPNGNVVLHQVEDVGNTSEVDGNPAAGDQPTSAANADPAGGTAYVDTVYKYDLLDTPVEAVREVANGASPTFLRTRYRYDANGNPVLVIWPAGNASSTVYDERDLPHATTVGALTAPPGALLASSDPSGYNRRGGGASTKTYHYDGNGNLLETVDAADTDGSSANNSDRGGLGDRLRYIYDGFDRRTSFVDSVGNQTVFQYDPAGNVVRFAHFGRVGGPTPKADGPDALAFPVSSGGIVQRARLVTPNLLSATENRYDELSRKFQVGRALFVNTVATIRGPDVADGAADLGKLDLTPGDTCAVPGLATPASGWRGCVTTKTEYDRSSRPTFAIQDDGDVSRIFYDGVDRAIRAIDPEGNSGRAAYDDAGNVIELQSTEVAQRAGVAREIFLTTFFYDSLGRPETVVDNLGQTQSSRYDSRDNLVASADANGPPGPAIARRAFTGGAKTVNTTNLFGNVRQFSYDGAGRPILETTILTASGKGDGVRIGANVFGVKTATPTPDLTQGGGDGLIRVRSAWDANSLLSGLTDDNGNVTSFTYDNLDRPVSEAKGACTAPSLADRCDPPTTMSFHYDADGNRVRTTDENGSATVCSFDAMDRRTGCAVTRAAGVVGTTATAYEYDGLSRLVRATDNNDPAVAGDDSLVTLAYDSVDRTIEEGQRIGALSIRSVDSAWRGENLRSRLVYPNGRAVAYRYDGADRLTAVQEGAVTFAAYSYIGPGRLLERAYPLNGTRSTFLDAAGTAPAGYDGLGRPIQLRHVGVANAQLLSFAQAYDRAGNQLSETKLHALRESELSAYDSANRLLRFARGRLNATGDGIETPSTNLPIQRAFTLDGVGNWKRVDAETRRHSSFNEIIGRTAGATTTPILSDGNGNETDDGRYAYRWDAANRLRTVTRKSDGRVIGRYAYDALGRRIRKVVTESGSVVRTTHFYSDGGREIEERDGADALTQQYVHGVGVDEPVVLDRNLGGGTTATGTGDQRLFYHQNALGSIHALTDTAGKTVEAYQYDAYGRPTVFSPGANGVVDFGGDDVVAQGGSSRLANPYLFNGRRLDAETGLLYYRARYLETGQGRFLSRDPIGVWGTGQNLGNGYGYVGNSPANFTDPSGLDPAPDIPWGEQRPATWRKRGQAVAGALVGVAENFGDSAAFVVTDKFNGPGANFGFPSSTPLPNVNSLWEELKANSIGKIQSQEFQDARTFSYRAIIVYSLARGAVQIVRGVVTRASNEMAKNAASLTKPGTAAPPAGAAPNATATGAAQACEPCVAKPSAPIIRIVSGPPGGSPMPRAPGNVALEGKLVLLGDEIPMAQAAVKVPKLRGIFDVFIHGTQDGRFIINQGGAQIVLSPEQLAALILRSGRYTGGRVRLGSCWSGKSGAAEKLLDALKAQGARKPTIAAPRDILWPSDTGGLFVGPSSGWSQRFGNLGPSLKNPRGWSVVGEGAPQGGWSMMFPWGG